MRCTSSRFMASGFSQKTISPACAAAIACSACRAFGVAISTMSISFRPTTDLQSVSNVFPSQLRGHRLQRRAVSATDGLQLEAIGKGKESLRLIERVRMGAAHKAVPQHRNPESLLHVLSVSSNQGTDSNAFALDYCNEIPAPLHHRRPGLCCAIPPESALQTRGRLFQGKQSFEMSIICLHSPFRGNYSRQS